MADDSSPGRAGDPLIDPALAEALDDLERLLKQGADAMRGPSDPPAPVVDEHGQESFLPLLTPAPLAERAGEEDAPLPSLETSPGEDYGPNPHLPPLLDGLAGDARLERVIERLVSEVDIIASECVSEALSEVEAIVQARIRARIAAHLRIVLPELIDDMSRLD